MLKLPQMLLGRRSTTHYCTLVRGNLVTCRSKKQAVVARSSTEAKFGAIALGICELLLTDLKQDIKGHIGSYRTIRQHNITTIIFNMIGPKHVEIDRQFIEEKQECRLICTPYVSSPNQLADIQPKDYQRLHFKVLCTMRVSNILASA